MNILLYANFMLSGFPKALGLFCGWSGVWCVVKGIDFSQ